MKVHIICGCCGSTDFKFEIQREGYACHEGEPNEMWCDQATLICNNCSTITGLEELMPEQEYV